MLIYQVLHSKKSKSKLKASQPDTTTETVGQSEEYKAGHSPRSKVDQSETSRADQSERSRADQSEERNHRSATVDLEAVLKKVAEIQKEREKAGKGRPDMLDLYSRSDCKTLSAGSKEANTSTETLNTKVVSGSDSPRKSPRILKKQHSFDMDGIAGPIPQPLCNGSLHLNDGLKVGEISTSPSDNEHARHSSKSPLPRQLRVAPKQAAAPIETFATGKTLTSEMDPSEAVLSPEARSTGQGHEKGVTPVFHFEHAPNTSEPREDTPHNVATLNSIKEVNSESPQSGRRGTPLSGSKRWRSRRQWIPEVNVQDSSGSLELDSDNKVSLGSKESSPVAIPRSATEYHVPNNTPLNYGQQSPNTSLAPWDRRASEHGPNVSPNFHRRPSKRDKGRNKTPTRSPSGPGRSSLGQDAEYPFDMNLQARIKVADRPIRSFVKSR